MRFVFVDTLRSFFQAFQLEIDTDGRQLLRTAKRQFTSRFVRRTDAPSTFSGANRRF